MTKQDMLWYELPFLVQTDREISQWKKEQELKAQQVRSGENFMQKLKTMNIGDKKHDRDRSF